jgi:hypothetical protein
MNPARDSFEHMTPQGGKKLKRFAARIALIALTVTFLGAPLVAADLPLEFKGIRIGKRITDADPLVIGRPDARIVWRPVRRRRDRMHGRWRMDDLRRRHGVAIIEDQRIDALGITFNPGSWDTVLRAFAAKYGTPAKSGAETFQWQHSDGVIIATRYDKGSDDKSLILLASNAFLHRVNRATPVASGP